MSRFARSPALVATTWATASLSLACEPPDPLAGLRAPSPVPFAPYAIRTEAREYDITFTPDGREAFFTRRPRRQMAQIYTTRFEAGVWSEPEPTSFSLPGDESPHLAPDGRRLFFSSRRTDPGRSLDRSDNIWVVERDRQGWSVPRPVRGTVNHPRIEVGDFVGGNESAPWYLDGGTLLYSSAVDPDWGSDLYVADEVSGSFENVRPLGPSLNSVGSESSPTMSPDGRLLVFQAERGPSGVGGSDLYMAERTRYGWSRARPLEPPVNTERNEGFPGFSPSGDHLFFASDRDDPQGYWSIYVVETRALAPSGSEPASPPSR